jgi:hypothetical protein
MQLRRINTQNSRKTLRWPARIALAVLSTLTLAGLGTAAYAASDHAPTSKHRVLSVDVKGPAAAHSGWQGEYTYDVPAGITGLFFHYTCSTGHAISGAFRLPGSDPSENTINLVNNSPIEATSPKYSQWAWAFTWSGNTAPSGSQIIFNVDCS